MHVYETMHPVAHTADDMFARLQRAKKKALEGRDPTDPNG